MDRGGPRRCQVARVKSSRLELARHFFVVVQIINLSLALQFLAKATADHTTRRLVYVVRFRSVVQRMDGVVLVALVSHSVIARPWCVVRLTLGLWRAMGRADSGHHCIQLTDWMRSAYRSTGMKAAERLRRPYGNHELAACSSLTVRPEKHSQMRSLSRTQRMFDGHQYPQSIQVLVKPDSEAYRQAQDRKKPRY